jgi:hypothetical protein
MDTDEPIVVVSQGGQGIGCNATLISENSRERVSVEFCCDIFLKKIAIFITLAERNAAKRR